MIHLSTIMIKRSPKIFSSRPKLVIASSCIVAFGCQEYNFNKRVDPNEAVEETAIPPETEVPEEVTVPICENEDSLEFDIQMVEDCYVEAIVGTWTPVIEWTSTAPGDTYTTPVVGLLNGDDIPDVVVANVSGVTYALSGDTGAVIWSAGNVGFEPMTSAIADVNGDGLNDVVSGGSYGVTAFNGTDGSVIWSTSELSNGNTPQCGAIGLHDLEGDGTVEVVVGNMVLNGIDGSVRWKGTHGSGAGHGWAAPMGVAADVLRNGTLQVVVGNALYNPDGSVAWANGQSDGFVAVGQ